MSTPDFDLRALVREVCDRTDEADPEILAKAVNHRIGRSERDAALEQALTAYVRLFVSRDRHSYSPGGHVGRGSHNALACARNSSSKVTGIREAWRKMLRDRIPVGDGPGSWKFLADCTAEDLDYAARIREEQARRNEASAQRYRALAKQLQLHAVDTVGELPDDILAPTLGDES